MDGGGPTVSWGKTFLTFFVLMVAIGLSCGWCAQGIDPPPINTPTPTGSDVP